MHKNTRNGKNIGYFLPHFAVLLLLIVVLAGCSLGESSKEPTATPTLADQSIPTVAVDSPAGKGSPDPQETPTAVANAPTVSVPDATQTAAEQEWNAWATETVERTTVPLPIQTNEATVQPAAVSMDEAWGPTPGTTQVPIALDNDSMFLLQTVDPDGRFVVGAIVPRAIGSTTAARLVLVSAKDGHITEIAQYVGPDGTSLFMGNPPDWPLFGSDSDGETVVWNDQSAVHAYTISTGVTRTLWEPSAEQNSLPAPTPLPYFPNSRAPRVDHGIAVWQEYIYSQPKPPVAPARILKADLTTGEITELSSYGAEATLFWPYVGWIEYPRDANERTLYHHGIITLLNLETGEKKSLDNILDAITLGLSNDAIIYCRTSGQAFISDLDGKSSRLISGGDSFAYEYISLNERIVTWLSFPSTAYDLVQDKRVYLKPGSYPSNAMSLVKGHMLVWQTARTYIDLEGAQIGTILPNDQPVYLLNTDNLPK